MHGDSLKNSKKIRQKFEISWIGKKSTSQYQTMVVYTLVKFCQNPVVNLRGVAICMIWAYVGPMSHVKRQSPAKRVKIAEPWNKAQANIGPWHRLFVSSFVEIRSKTLREEAKKTSHWLCMGTALKNSKKIRQQFEISWIGKKSTSQYQTMVGYTTTSQVLSKSGRKSQRSSDLHDLSLYTPMLNVKVPQNA